MAGRSGAVPEAGTTGEAVRIGAAVPADDLLASPATPPAPIGDRAPAPSAGVMLGRPPLAAERLPDCEVLNQRGRFEVHAEIVEDAAGLPVHLGAVDHAISIARLAAEEDVLGNAQPRHEVELLVDDLDPAGDGVGR